MSFKRKDRIIVCSREYCAPIYKQTGTILSKKRYADNYLVEFDNFMGGHNGADSRVKGMIGHCWWVNGEHMKSTKVKRPNIKTRVDKMCEHLYAM